MGNNDYVWLRREQVKIVPSPHSAVSMPPGTILLLFFHFPTLSPLKFGSPPDDLNEEFQLVGAHLRTKWSRWNGTDVEERERGSSWDFATHCRFLSHSSNTPLCFLHWVRMGNHHSPARTKKGEPWKRCKSARRGIISVDFPQHKIDKTHTKMRYACLRRTRKHTRCRGKKVYRGTGRSN
jgi:hypothetical protein